MVRICLLVGIIELNTKYTSSNSNQKVASKPLAEGSVKIPLSAVFSLPKVFANGKNRPYESE